MRNLHILIIEDHSDLSIYVQRSLESEGYDVTSISSTQNALQHIHDAKWSLIILDRIFPGPHGSAFVSELRKALPHTPILTLSDSPKKHTEDETRKANIDDCILKPFAFQELLSRVKELLNKNDKFAHELILDNLVVDTKDHIVRRGGKTITLTKKELSLLTFLMKHRDHAVPRADLLEHVWGMQIDPLSNTIEAHILSLRHKIDGQGQTKLIHTVPKFGYRMSVHK